MLNPLLDQLTEHQWEYLDWKEDLAYRSELESPFLPTYSSKVFFFTRYNLRSEGSGTIDNPPRNAVRLQVCRNPPRLYRRVFFGASN